jgi:hypothetical protein
VHPSERRRRGEDGDILARGEQIDGLLVALEINKTALFRNIDAFLELALETLVARLEPVLENIRHGDELHRSGLNAQGVGSGTRSTATGTHKHDVDRVGVGHMGGASWVQSNGGNGGGHGLSSTACQQARDATGTGNGSGAL